MLVTTYLHMTDPAQFRPSFLNDPRVVVRRLDRADVRFYRFLYSAVGERWRWRDRLLLSDDELHHILSQPHTTVYVLYYDGAPAIMNSACVSSIGLASASGARRKP